MGILCCLTSGLIYFRLCFDMLAVEMLTTAMEITWKQWKGREGCSLVTTILTGGVRSLLKMTNWWKLSGRESRLRPSAQLLTAAAAAGDTQPKVWPAPGSSASTNGSGGRGHVTRRPTNGEPGAVSAVLWNYQGTRMRRKKGMKAVTQLQTFITVWIISNAEKQ